MIHALWNPLLHLLKAFHLHERRLIFSLLPTISVYIRSLNPSPNYRNRLQSRSTLCAIVRSLWGLSPYHMCTPGRLLYSLDNHQSFPLEDLLWAKTAALL